MSKKMVEIWSAPGGDWLQGYYYLPKGLSPAVLERSLNIGIDAWLGYRRKKGYRLLAKPTVEGPFTPLDLKYAGQDLWRFRALFKLEKPKYATLEGVMATQRKMKAYGVEPREAILLETDPDQPAPPVNEEHLDDD